jgi:uncharacterized repeat protein (TIGR03803 family)
LFLAKGESLVQQNKPSIGLIAVLALFMLTVVASGTRAAAQQESVLHTFLNNGKDGTNPVGPLIFDDAGNLYGTTQNGGAHNTGTAFELSPLAGGGWNEQVLYSFNGLDGNQDGIEPFGGLVRDASGRLYGTTYEGGAYNAGTVFELVPGTGGWSESILHSFAGPPDGKWPVEGLTLDAAGNLYGTTVSGGSTTIGNCDPDGCGTVFELVKGTDGGWTEKIVHSFDDSANGGDGGGPFSVLTFDAAGNLYGTTSVGGTYGAGTVFELSPTKSGEWTESILYSFGISVSDGTNPYAGVIFDSAGNLYGVAHQGPLPPYLYGNVFELSPAGGGVWNETVLHTFGIGTDGQYPLGALIFDAYGNLYGTANAGGVGFGTAFELTASNGTWTEKTLAEFDLQDGANPQSGLIFDRHGNLYSTTMRGGSTDNAGVLFEIKP